MTQIEFDIIDDSLRRLYGAIPRPTATDALRLRVARKALAEAFGDKAPAKAPEAPVEAPQAAVETPGEVGPTGPDDSGLTGPPHPLEGLSVRAVQQAVSDGVISAEEAHAYESAQELPRKSLLAWLVAQGDDDDE